MIKIVIYSFVRAFVSQPIHWVRCTFFAWSLDPTPEQMRERLADHVRKLEADVAASAAGLNMHRANHNGLVAQLREYRKALKEWK